MTLGGLPKIIEIFGSDALAPRGGWHLKRSHAREADLRKRKDGRLIFEIYWPMVQ